MGVPSSHPVGTVKRISRFSVKSMGGEDLPGTVLPAAGIPHDRCYAVTGEDGRPISSKAEPRLLEARAEIEGNQLRINLPGGAAFRQGAALDSALSAWLGRTVALRRVSHSTAYRVDGSPEFARHLRVDLSLLPAPLKEASHLHVLTTAACHTITARHPEVTAGEFRSTFLIDTDDAGIQENRWLGRRLQMGSAVMVLFGPEVACCTLHKGTAGDDVNMYGVHGIVIEPGAVAVGDVVSLVGAT